MKTRHNLLICLFLVAVSCGDENDGIPTAGVAALCEGITDTDLILLSQADVEAAASVERVAGDLVVCNAADLSSLSLPVLTAVDGNVIIYGNNTLERIELPVLDSVGELPHLQRSWRGLLIEANPLLEEVVMPEVREISDHLWVATNVALLTFDLPSLIRTHGAAAFRATAITTLDGLANLRFVGGALALYDNQSLTDVSGFGSLISVSNDLILQDNPALTSFALPQLRSIGSTIEIVNVPELATLGLDGVETVGGSITVREAGLTDLGGLGGVEVVGARVSVTDCAQLTSALLPSLQQVGGDFELSDNELLTDFGAELLSFVGGSVIFSGNAVLAGVLVTGLVQIGDSLIVNDNPALPTCAVEAVRDAVGVDNIGGEVSIVGNDDEGTCI